VHGPASPGWLLVALCAATGAYCLLRMRSPVEEQRRTAGAEALMGFGMAAMAVPAAAATPPRWTWFAYAAVFGAAAVRALWSARTSPHHLHHLVGACAMVYMAVAMAASPGHHGHAGGSGIPLMTGALLLYFAGYVLRSGARLLPAAATAGGSAGNSGTLGGTPRTLGWGDRPELSQACRLSMGIAMVAMLVTL
jgi:peptidoglycan/LPS O-acetylase OafA/YrhL